MYDNCFGSEAVDGTFAEEYPGGQVSFDLFPTPGDTVTATVSDGSGGWQATVTDETTGQSATAGAPGYAGGGCAEWMAEAYGISAGEPVSDFGSEQLGSFAVNRSPAAIPESDVFAMANVSPTDPASGIYRLTYS